MPKTTQVKGKRHGERLFIDISAMNMKSLGISKFWELVVYDFSNFIWRIFFQKKLDLSENIIPILKKLYIKVISVK